LETCSSETTCSSIGKPIKILQKYIKKYMAQPFHTYHINIQTLKKLIFFKYGGEMVPWDQVLNLDDEKSRSRIEGATLVFASPAIPEIGVTSIRNSDDKIELYQDFKAFFHLVESLQK